MGNLVNMLSVFQGKRVLVTGHTGFKGSWLVAWLHSLGARVTGIALDPPTVPSHFDAAGLARLVTDYRVDIRNRTALQSLVQSSRPEFVFHMAAQPLVRQSYRDPVETYETNVLGTIHVLEALRLLSEPCIAVLITSDKCYDNVEWVWGYRESDALGGPDPYSASKGAAEIAIRSYVKSFFSPPDNFVRIAVARAGNVIGGGDWAPERVVPDCVRAWSEGKHVELRSPLATRPWQHVLEPLSGYLTLAAALMARPELHGEPFNFGPSSQQNHTVLDLVEQMSRYWDRVRWVDVSQNHDGPHESGLLKLNCDKALHYLRWQPVLEFSDTVRFTAEWYQQYYNQPGHTILDRTIAQIANYTEQAKSKRLPWAL